MIFIAITRIYVEERKHWSIHAQGDEKKLQQCLIDTEWNPLFQRIALWFSYSSYAHNARLRGSSQNTATYLSRCVNCPFPTVSSRGNLTGLLTQKLPLVILFFSPMFFSLQTVPQLLRMQDSQSVIIQRLVRRNCVKTLCWRSERKMNCNGRARRSSHIRSGAKYSSYGNSSVVRNKWKTPPDAWELGWIRNYASVKA